MTQYSVTSRHCDVAEWDAWEQVSHSIMSECLAKTANLVN